MCFVGAFAKLRKVTISFVLPVHLSLRPPALDSSVPTVEILMKIYMRIFFRKICPVKLIVIKI